MKLSTLLQGLSVRRTNACDPYILNLSEDSRLTRPGALFFARAGTKSDGLQFVNDALAAGAVAIVAPTGAACPVALSSSDSPVIAWIEVDDPAHAAAIIAERFFANPTKSLALVGITGTNGKTTIAYLVQQLLVTAGMRCGLVGTVETDDGLERVPSKLTTPPSIELSDLFARMVDNGCRAAAMEVSSHSLDQQRVAALAFRVAIFTNLTGDHLDYHGTMESYGKAKAALFHMLDAEGTAIINVDDPSASMMLPPRAKLLRTSLRDTSAECFGEVHRSGLDAMDVTFHGPWGAMELKLPLVGSHNAMNALQAAAAAWSLGVSREQLARGLTTCHAPPGRLQPVDVGAAGFKVLVDYAHSDDALANVLRAVRSSVPAGGTLRLVFGCGGNRDASKRPRMAAVACAAADDIIITSDNPRLEDAASIIEDILKGVPAKDLSRVRVEVDRAKAIAMAVRSARAGDIVLIAGKGHEDYQIIGTEKRYFDDRVEAAAAARRAGLPT